MFKNRLTNIIVVVSITMLAALTMAPVIYTQQVPSSAADNSLDWYSHHGYPVVDDSTTSNVTDNTLDGYLRQNQSTLPGEGASASTNRNFSAQYLTMKDRRINQDDVGTAKAASSQLPASKSYAAMKELQIEQNDVALVKAATKSLATDNRYAAMKAQQIEKAGGLGVGNPFGIAVTGSAKSTRADLPEPILNQLNPSETGSAGRARYLNLKAAQIDK